MTLAVPPSLEGAPEHAWLSHGRTLALHGELAAALALYRDAAERFPESADIRLGWAGLHWQSGQHDAAERLLRDWLQAHPADEGATFLLAQLLREQGRLRAVGETVRALFEHGTHDIDTIIRAVEMLDDFGLPNDAFIICEHAIDTGPNDPRLHAYAGMLAIQLGKFARTREHYAYALEHEPAAVDWNIPLGLSGLQRYTDSSHPDLAFLQGLLQRPALSASTRRATLFALGKAHDDLGDYAAATHYLREANALAHADSTWSRKKWKRGVDARLASSSSDIALPPPGDWAPIFIVGVPRSGTTLLAERLARHPEVKNRGELGWLEHAEQRLSSAAGDTERMLEQIARDVARQLLQDDDRARWYIDKQPMNLLRVDLAMRLWPNARIIHCERDARDTALSLWMQSFNDAAHDYAYDFGDIAAVIRDCRRLAAHWGKRYPSSFLNVSYEALVSAPGETLDGIAQWLGLTGRAPDDHETAPRGIATASAWQARQAVFTSSVGRWQHYAPYLPELAAFDPR
ncbi:Tetratricopeptide repeat-containing protein [Dyella jiangningensis]|uniref:tetratricopeptide repeat-containing sulfotransferase family protein n=1 Tax=Dyella sp. AtDHG13 TaxID=1938897 RepID=UPI00088750BE|nr:sulfotransferase [Dyella sp. AtDHG13]PXV57358.1 tetratricopeptide repeat protein [Dyella sp. AtDHG13]SDK41521.1 Tetratricopeptide repeat-containing protein [Dyella jiangningensis]